MTDNRWKLVVDQQGVTITSDRFRLTANGTRSDLHEFDPEAAVLEAVDTTRIEGIISELQTMTRQTYGQYCGLSRASEMVGERWALLVIRDLLVGPKSVAQLLQGLPRAQAEVLCSRLHELRHFGVVRPQGDPAADGTVVYELTEYGQALEDVVMALGRWGALSLNEPRPEEIITSNGVVMALRSCFQADAARSVTASFELRLGEVVVHARVEDGVLHAAEGPLPDADLVLDPGPMLKLLLSREILPVEALASGQVSLVGDPMLLDRFTELFFIPPLVSAARS
ncbi:winged helix-turn-helix transcriptional regulator [Actinokineospora sp.]|uniref:winged helix-turn-helix transcriptional regulator n=1 Tax=Actinokineospora sp. TaxID=1872133 RepID=UPI004037AFAE